MSISLPPLDVLLCEVASAQVVPKKLSWLCCLPYYCTDLNTGRGQGNNVSVHLKNNRVVTCFKVIIQKQILWFVKLMERWYFMHIITAFRKEHRSGISTGDVINTVFCSQPEKKKSLNKNKLLDK